MLIDNTLFLFMSSDSKPTDTLFPLGLFGFWDDTFLVVSSNLISSAFNTCPLTTFYEFVATVLLTLLVIKVRIRHHPDFYMMLNDNRLSTRACQWKKSRSSSENMCSTVSRHVKMESLSLNSGCIR